ncbi:MAG: hypothetical protein HOC09_08830 [Deltaproteobacteria bacterium]|nr:hypothetical protein [Deltaproteobacteria bacterium]
MTVFFILKHTDGGHGRMPYVLVDAYYLHPASIQESHLIEMRLVTGKYQYLFLEPS